MLHIFWEKCTVANDTLSGAIFCSKTQMSKAEKDAYEAQLQEHKSLAQAAQVERDKLMELLQVTQKR